LRSKNDKETGQDSKNCFPDFRTYDKAFYWIFLAVKLTASTALELVKTPSGINQ